MVYLICNPVAEEIETYLVDLDGTVTESPPNIIGDGSKRLFFDVTGVSTGAHTVIIRSKNRWGESEPSDPFTFEKNLPSTPSGIGLSDS
jgi:hypothetical protein